VPRMVAVPGMLVLLVVVPVILGQAKREKRTIRVRPLHQSRLLEP